MDSSSAEVFKVTVKNSNGTPMIAYLLPSAKHAYVRSMMEEYGNATVEPMMMSDLPEGVSFGE